MTNIRSIQFNNVTPQPVIRRTNQVSINQCVDNRKKQSSLNNNVKSSQSNTSRSHSKATVPVSRNSSSSQNKSVASAKKLAAQQSHKKNNTPKSNHSKQSNNNGSNGKKPGKSLLPLYVLAGIALAFLIYSAFEFLYKPMQGDSKKLASENVETTTDKRAEDSDKIEKNIYFSGISLEGMSFSDFEALMKEKNSKLGQENLNIKSEHAKTQPDVKISDLGYQYDAEKMYDNAITLSDILRGETPDQSKSAGLLAMISKNGQVEVSEEQIKDLASKKDDKFELNPVYKVNDEVFDKEIDKIVEDFSTGSEDGNNITFNVETLKFEYESLGTSYVVEKEDLIQQIEDAVTSNTFDKAINLKFKETENAASNEELNSNLGYISSGYTPFVTYDPPRDANVNRVSESLTGMVLMPGEEFSYMTSISPITPENGYQQGYQIGADGQPELILGGGICQGSSTLYNAVVRADLEIVERNNHTVPSVYITQGLDSMVSDWSDFKFRNNTDYPIAIVGTCVAGEYIQFDIYGRLLEDGVTIDLEAFYQGEDQPGAPKRVQNNDLAPGEEVVVTPAIVGSFWSTDKVYYKDGVEFDRVHLNNSHYWAYAAVVEYGPSSSSTTETTTEATTPAPTTTETTTEATTPAPTTTETTTEATTPDPTETDLMEDVAEPVVP